MEKEKVHKTIQVWVLDSDVKNEIKKRLYKALKNKYTDIEIDEYVSNGMDSRLCDLEDTINIYNIEGLYLEGGI